MNTAYRTLFAGMLAIVFSATAVAHDNHGADWSGGLSVAVTPGGHLSVGGALAYGPVVALPAVRVAYVEHGYRPVCRHPSHRYDRRYRGEYRHGKGHGRHHHAVYRGKHGRGHGRH